jgi:hypothetical protein
MSATSDTGDHGGFQRGDSDVWAAPSVELDWDVDDPVRPETVTIFERRSDTTTWLSADFDHAISLADAR